MVHTSPFIFRLATIALIVVPTLTAPIPWYTPPHSPSSIHSSARSSSSSMYSSSEPGSPNAGDYWPDLIHSAQHIAELQGIPGGRLHGSHSAPSSGPGSSNAGGFRWPVLQHPAQHPAELHGIHGDPVRVPSHGGGSSSFGPMHNKWHGPPLIIPGQTHDDPHSPAGSDVWGHVTEFTRLHGNLAQTGDNSPHSSTASSSYPPQSPQFLTNDNQPALPGRDHLRA